MYCDLPKLMRCCFCLPLRHGVLIFGYLNLVFAILTIAVISYVLDSGRGDDGVTIVFRGNIIDTNAVLLLIILVLDVIFNLVLIVGAHKKNVLLMKYYYYYAISTTLATWLLNVCLMWRYMLFVEELCMLFSGVVLQVYLVLVVRSEILKLEAPQSAQYVNRLADIVVCDQPSPALDTRSIVITEK